MDLGQRLKDARIKRNLTQEELAKELGVSRQTLYNWESGRSAPDVLSIMKLGKFYGMSLDRLLNGEDITRQLEDMVTRRRRFWQMMLEIGVIIELLGQLLTGLEFLWLGELLFWTGMGVLTVAIIMHLYVFDHSGKQCAGGILGLTVHWTAVLASAVLPGFVTGMSAVMIQSAAAWLIWYAGVWTVDWKSTRLWLIFALLAGTPLLLMGKGLQKSGMLAEKTPFPGDYRVEEAAYSQKEGRWENAVVKLGSSSLTVAYDGVNGDYIGMFTYCKPNLEDDAEGIWLLENQGETYRLTLETDGSVYLSYTKHDALQWKWKLKKDHRKASVRISTFGHTTFKDMIWYPPGAEDPVPYFGNTVDVVMNAKVNFAVGGMGAVTLYEEYHHDGQVDHNICVLEPNRNGSYSLAVKVRYEGIKEQYAVYRIPFEDGEYRFILTFAGLW